MTKPYSRSAISSERPAAAMRPLSTPLTDATALITASLPIAIPTVAAANTSRGASNSSPAGRGCLTSRAPNRAVAQVPRKPSSAMAYMKTPPSCVRSANAPRLP